MNPTKMPEADRKKLEEMAEKYSDMGISDDAAFACRIDFMAGAEAGYALGVKEEHRGCINQMQIRDKEIDTLTAECERLRKEADLKDAEIADLRDSCERMDADRMWQHSLLERAKRLFEIQFMSASSEEFLTDLEKGPNG